MEMPNYFSTISKGISIAGNVASYSVEHPFRTAGTLIALITGACGGDAEITPIPTQTPKPSPTATYTPIPTSIETPTSLGDGEIIKVGRSDPNGIRLVFTNSTDTLTVQKLDSSGNVMHGTSYSLPDLRDYNGAEIGKPITHTPNFQGKILDKEPFVGLMVLEDPGHTIEVQKFSEYMGPTHYRLYWQSSGTKLNISNAQTLDLRETAQEVLNEIFETTPTRKEKDTEIWYEPHKYKLMKWRASEDEEGVWRTHLIIDYKGNTLGDSLDNYDYFRHVPFSHTRLIEDINSDGLPEIIEESGTAGVVEKGIIGVEDRRMLLRDVPKLLYSFGWLRGATNYATIVESGSPQDTVYQMDEEFLGDLIKIRDSLKDKEKVSTNTSSSLDSRLDSPLFSVRSDGLSVPDYGQPIGNVFEGDFVREYHTADGDSVNISIPASIFATNEKNWEARQARKSLESKIVV